MITRDRQKQIAQELEGLDISRRATELYAEMFPDFVPFADFHDVLMHMRLCRETGDPLWPEDVPPAAATDQSTETDE